MKQLISLLLLAASISVFAQGEQAAQQAPILLAPGYGPLTFEAPAAGTYKLPVYGKATDGHVINSHGTHQTLNELMGDKVVLLSFIYATCNDVNGCPLSTAVFHKIKRRLSKAGLKDDLRLITLSFNPKHDTPDVMANYAKSLETKQTDWRFLTTESQKELRPILEGYNQTIQQEYDDEGQSSGTFSHTLRVYLIDTHKKIRKIYSVGFLHPDILINDVKTLTLE
ncbi:MAG: photosynthetic protein synthase I [Piscirickettsiaceae bacterium]|nr:MAG: photosynthetic protein synthase I [Piscirickettsiaceae bacterium]